MIGALWYLVRRTLYNRLARQVSRVRSPRYAAAMLIGIVFLWMVFFSPIENTSPGGAGGVGGMGSEGFATVAAIYFALSWIWSWWRGSTALALAFQPAEVHMLFSAPIPRRVLIAYKLARSQLLVLVNAIIWIGLLRRWGLGISAPIRFATAWEVFTLLSLYRFATALVRVPPVTGARKAILATARVLGVAILAALVAGVIPALEQVGRLGGREGLESVGALLQKAPAAYALAPFRLVLSPLFATTVEAWVPAFLLVAGIIAAHLLWVLGVNVRFEETAAVASAELAKRFAAFKRGGGFVATKPKNAKPSREWLPLAPTGNAAIAIVWKNTISWVRYGGLRSATVMVALVAAGPLIVAFVPERSADDAAALAFVAMIPFLWLFAMSLFIGPRILRNDLRQDLTSLPLLKTYPLPASQIMLAEMASPVLALTSFQTALLLTALLTMPASIREQLAAFPFVLLLLAPIVLSALNAAGLAIQNAIVMLFPAWVRLGPDAGGLEMIGQNVLVTVGGLLVLVLGLLPPALVGGTAFLMTRSLGLTPAIAIAAMVGSATLLSGVVMAGLALGAVFERTEPAAIV